MDFPITWTELKPQLRNNEVNIVFVEKSAQPFNSESFQIVFVASILKSLELWINNWKLSID